MKNIYSYLKKYGMMTFEEKEFNEIDNLILSMIPYVLLNGIIPNLNEKDITIYEANREFQKKHSIKEIKNSGIAIKKASLMFPVLAESNRFKNLKIGNCSYTFGDDYQFGACTIKLTRNLMFVAFEGTDDLISGWLEDFKMSYKYPVTAQVLASSYLNKVTKLFKEDIIVGGHSKGGNLALVASMNLPFYKKHKLINVYCNDSPGLRKREIESLKFRSIENKVISFIPNGSIVGIILRHKEQIVIKSTGFGPLQHDAFTWEVNDDKLVRGKQSKSSVKLEKAILNWLDKHNDQERRNIVNSLFLIFKEAEITDLRDLKKEKLTHLLKIISVSKNIDAKTKSTIKTSITLLLSEYFVAK